MVDFTSMPKALGYFRPSRFDAEIFDCEVVGRIPADLDGAFYRMHGDWFYPPWQVDEASLSADGYISMFRIKGGVADYRGRYVRTERFENQRRARRQLYGYYRNPYTDQAEVRDLQHPGRRTTANTTPVILAQQLFATKEEGLPYRIDPNTLSTLGPEDFAGRWPSHTFTAHPKYDPGTGETVAFGYEASGLAARDVLLGTFDNKGVLQRTLKFDVPHTTMLHDMAITERHVVLPGSSAVTSTERLEQGRIHWGWDPRVQSYYGIIPREGKASDIRWYRGPERSIVHTANAWSEGNVVYLDLPAADGNTWPFFPDVHGAPFRMHPNTIRRLRFDLDSDSDTYTEQVLFKQEVTSFTRIDERFLARPHRYIFVQYVDPALPFTAVLPDDPRAIPTNSIARFDLSTGEMLSFQAGTHHVVQEPCFVPRSASSAEGDGYLLATVHNLKDMRAELTIVDAATMTEVARVLLPFRNPYQVHGTWADPTQLPLI
jgi:carotenoid cleavage dioxygenase